MSVIYDTCGVIMWICGQNTWLEGIMQCMSRYFCVKINYRGASQFVCVVMMIFYTKHLLLFQFIPWTKLLYVLMNSLIHVCVLLVVWRSYKCDFPCPVSRVVNASLQVLHIFFLYFDRLHHTHQWFKLPGHAEAWLNSA